MTGARQQNTPGAGWEYVHVTIDDHTRVAFSSVHLDETSWSACLALLQAMRYYTGLGIRFTRVLTDNGACYRSRRFQRLCRRLSLKHRRTKPVQPAHQWQGGTIHPDGATGVGLRSVIRQFGRARQAPACLHQYNWHRPHASLDYHPLVSRLGLSVNNLMGLHS